MKQNKIIVKVKEAQNYIFHDIWKIETRRLPRVRQFMVWLIRTFVLAFRGFNEDKVNLRASSLTFFSLLSVVPIMAMAFGIAKGFGFDDRLQTMLQENMKGQEDVARWLIDFSGNMLNSVKGGLMAGIGLTFLIWTVLKVLGNIESAFNGIWQVKKSRVFFRKFSDYFSMMLIAPIMIFLSSSSQVLIIEMVDKMTQEISIIGEVSWIIYSLVKLIPYILVWLLFTFVYMVMPNTKVKFSSALIAGIIAGTAFQFLQWGYFHFQIGVSRYNAIYGSFAALPLFLVWLNWSWLIVLFGAEVSFSAQNQQKYEFEKDIKGLSLYSRQLIAVYITHFIVKNFAHAQPPATAQGISEKLKLPLRLVRHVLYSLVESEIVAETPSKEKKETGFLPAFDIQAMSILSIMNKMNDKGSEFTNIEKNATFKQLDDALQSFRTNIQGSPANMLLKDVM